MNIRQGKYIRWLLIQISLILLAAGGTLLVSCAPRDGKIMTPSQEPILPDIQAIEETGEAIEAGEPSATVVEDPFETPREHMVTWTIEPRGVEAEDVLRAMRTVPRHEFVPDQFWPQAYADHPLPIGYGQTISQPYIVAWMTELLALQPGDKVLEIGTGSGYQAAVLAEMGTVEVYSIEIVPELAEEASLRLQALGYDDIHLKQGDGYFGWEEYAPFDAIIVTAAPDHMPAPLLQQTKNGGRVVIPIGPPGGYQSLWQFTKEGEEGVTARNLGSVVFVPFTGGGITGGD